MDEAEAMAARQSFSVAMEASLRNIELENDCLRLVTHLKQGKRENSSFDNIVLDILELGKYCLSISYSHVCRSGNQVAHNLAKLSCNYGELRVLCKQ